MPYSSTQSSVTPHPYWTTQTFSSSKQLAVRFNQNEEPVPAEILDVMTRRDDLRKRYHTSPELPRLNYDIQNCIYAHKRQKFRDSVETLEQKTDVTKLWSTIKGIDGRAKREAENEAITFNGSSFSSSKQLVAMFNQQFTTSKLGRHTSSGETRLVTRETKMKSLEMSQTFTADLVRRAIKICKNSKAFVWPGQTQHLPPEASRT